MSAEHRLRAALAAVDEPTLAESLRVSIATLRRYASGELRMNWVICTRLAALEQRAVLVRRTDTASPRARTSPVKRRSSQRPAPISQPVAVAV